MTAFIEVNPLHEYTYNGRTWHIEIPPIGGPVPIKENGEPYQRIPREFWDAYEAWRDQLQVSQDVGDSIKEK